jgi:hypothetical protein
VAPLLLAAWVILQPQLTRERAHVEHFPAVGAYSDFNEVALLVATSISVPPLADCCVIAWVGVHDVRILPEPSAPSSLAASTERRAEIEASLCQEGVRGRVEAAPWARA